MLRKLCSALVLPLLLVGLVIGAEKDDKPFKTGSVKLTSAGPLAFGPYGVLFVGDPMAAKLYAIQTGENKGDASGVKINVKDIKSKIGSLIGVNSKQVTINDLAASPQGNVYLSVSRGRGAEAQSVLIKVDAKGDLDEFELDKVEYAVAEIPNAPASRQGRRGNPRMNTITDIQFVAGRVFIAGLSNEEFASNLRAIPYPFRATDATSVEIYHGAHGGFETRSPVRTFTAYKIDGQDHILAAYTCTPLVKFPVSKLKAGSHIKGTTIAELGNRNRPLDMFVYNKGGKDYILMANSSRGMMKITTENIGEIKGIEARVSGKAGLTYETIESMKGVQQLDRLNTTSAIALIQDESGINNLMTVDLP